MPGISWSLLEPMSIESGILFFAQLYLTLCRPMDCSPPGSSVQGILQARILGWVAMPFSRGSSPPRDRTHISGVSCPGRRVFTTGHLCGGRVSSLISWRLSSLYKNKQIAVHPFVVIHLLSRARLSATPWAAAARLLCPALSPGLCSNSHS